MVMTWENSDDNFVRKGYGLLYRETSLAGPHVIASHLDK